MITTKNLPTITDTRTIRAICKRAGLRLSKDLGQNYLCNSSVAERIVKAQASRGSDWGTKKKGLVNRIKQVVPMIIPLFITSLRRSENLALAMDARAYGVYNRRTSMTEMHFTWKDALAVLISIMVSLAIFLV